MTVAPRPACCSPRPSALSSAASGNDDASTSAAPTSQACESRSATAPAPDGVSAGLGVAPDVPATDAAPRCDLEISDVVVGTGAEASEGTATAVEYVGAFSGTGEQFDFSWSRGDDETLPVTVGAGGQGPIPGGATLVFVIELVQAG
jgi:hypothetical protein